MLFFHRPAAILMSIFIAFTTTASAQSSASLNSDAVLTVTGAVNQDPTVFDLEMLMALDATVIETTTIWTEDVQVFQGVALAVLMET